MLEMPFQQLIQRIREVQNSHKESPGEGAMRSLDWQFIFSEFSGWIVLWCSSRQLNGYWLYPKLCPEDRVESLKKQLPQFNFVQPSAAYNQVMSGDEHRIEQYWDDDSQNAEIPLFFEREYYGNPPGCEHYHEFNQLVTHPLGLHWSPRKNAYCCTDRNGDEVEKIKLIKHSGTDVTLMRRRSLDKLLYLGRWVLVRYFEFRRYSSDHPSFAEGQSVTCESAEQEAIFEMRSCGDEYAGFRGASILRPRTPRDELLSWKVSDDEDEESGGKYAEFVVWDWKNEKLLHDYSLRPDNFANYFTASELPFGMSPIFFKAEVLDKYKSNPDKYDLIERAISCRGGWSLETYDINEYNQVHTYAVYLGRLPYREQLHWKQYNEEPKGPISKRSFQTDFEGRFTDEISGLERLRQVLEKMAAVRVGREGFAVWSYKGGCWEAASKGLYYVNSENPNQWHDFIIALANSTNEGFKTEPLKRIAAQLGNQDDSVRSLGLVRFILEASRNEDLVATTHGVLRHLQERRGKGKAHGTWATPNGSLVEDARDTLQGVTLAMEKLAEFFANVQMPQERY
jgi:hypothetical protein